MKLHLGSGEHYYDGWVNVDVDDQWPTDVTARAQDLPQLFAAESFDRVYLGHVLEHLPFDDIPGILGAVLAVCTAAVQIAVVGPAYELAEIHAPELLYNIADRGETSPGAHRWTATTALTRQALEDSGLAVLEVPVAAITRPEWPNPSTAVWQCAFFARRP